MIAEDDWLNALFGQDMTTPSDYVRYAFRLQAIMGPHVSSLLNTGLSVVLDFPANTVESRRWMRGIIDATDVSHQLHVLDPPDSVCLERLRQRNAAGQHQFAATEAQFHQVSKHFVAPSPDEGFHIIRHDAGG